MTFSTIGAVLGACNGRSACNPAGNLLPGTPGQVMGLKGVDAFFDALIKHAHTREPDLYTAKSIRNNPKFIEITVG